MRIATLARRSLVVVGAWLLAGCASTRPAEFLTTTVGPPRPFSPAVRVNGFIFLSGQVGTDSSGKLVPGGITGETR
ncbi:MAG TPA: RidA family protein, partial [Gemmatimonadaceae bacterium]|nr:RidA family protein [Gemmatimonadaceae bacterium]